MTTRDVPRIAVYGQAGAPYHHIAAFARQGCAVRVVFPDEIRAGALEPFDAFVIPGGGYDGMHGQVDPLGPDGAAAVADFVASGGLYLGSCAGAYDAASAAPAFQQLSPAQSSMQLTPARVWNEDRVRWADLVSPGVGVIRVRNDLPAHPIMAGLPHEFDLVHYNGPLFEGGTSLVSVQGVTDDFTAGEDFLDLDAPGPTMIERAASMSVAAAVVERFGAGRVALFGGHPEFGFALGSLRDAQLPGQLLSNAVRWQISEHGVSSGALPDLHAMSAFATSPEAVDTVVRAIRTELHALTQRSLDRTWMSGVYAMSIFGLEPRDIWRSGLSQIPALLDEIVRLSPGVEPALLTYRPDPQWEVDFGYQGVLALLTHARDMLAKANANWEVELGPPDSYAYAYIHESPYHLVAGSYLAAIGWITAAALLCQCPPGLVNAARA